MKNQLYNFLRRTASWTGTDMVYLAENGFWAFLSYTFTVLSGFFLVLVMTRFLSQETYGLYAYVISIVNVLQLSTLPGMHAALIQAVSRGLEGSLSRAIRLKLLGGLAGMAASFILSLYYYLTGQLTLAACFASIGFIFPFIRSFADYETLLIGRCLFKQNSLYRIALQAFAVAAPLAALIFSKNLIIILMASFLSLSLGGLSLFWHLKNRYRPNDKADEKTIPYGFHLSVLDAIKFLGENIDRIIIFNFFGPANLAVYALALLPIKKFQDLNILAREISLPKLSRQSDEVIKKGLTAKILKFCLVWLLVALAYMLAAPILYKLAFPAYTGSILLSQLLALTVIFLPSDFYSVYFRAKMKKGLLYIINISGPTLKIALFFILIPKFRLMGAVTSIVIAQAALAGLNYFLFKKY